MSSNEYIELATKTKTWFVGKVNNDCTQVLDFTIWTEILGHDIDITPQVEGVYLQKAKEIFLAYCEALKNPVRD